MAILDPKMLTNNGLVQLWLDHQVWNLGILTNICNENTEFWQYSLFSGTFMAFHTTLHKFGLATSWCAFAPIILFLREALNMQKSGLHTPPKAK